jgi:hypothetical protein
MGEIMSRQLYKLLPFSLALFAPLCLAGIRNCISQLFIIFSCPVTSGPGTLALGFDTRNQYLHFHHHRYQQEEEKPSQSQAKLSLVSQWVGAYVGWLIGSLLVVGS